MLTVSVFQFLHLVVFLSFEKVQVKSCQGLETPAPALADLKAPELASNL